MLAAAVVVAALATAADSSGSPRFVLVLRLATPHVSAGSALRLARSLGLDAPAARESPSSYAVTSGPKQLVVFKASGAFDYVDRATYGQAPSGPLPSATDARRAAEAFLRTHRLAPIGVAGIDVSSDSAASARALVATVRPLAAGAPVRDGTITFWFGGQGTLTRLRDDYRPLAPGAVRVSARPRRQVLAELRSDLGTTSGLRLHLAYLVAPPYLRQPYLDPVYEAVQDGIVVDRVRATRFTPRVAITSPNPNTPLSAGSVVHLRAKASEGRHPYVYSWSANRSGYLGSGKALDRRLRAGDTELRLTVRDSSGAGTTYVEPVEVAGASPAPGGPQEPTYADGEISFQAAQDRTHPLVFRDIEADGSERASEISFDQFRYTVTVHFQGVDYHIGSRKCVPLTVVGDACELPKSPYAQSSGATPPAAGSVGSRVDSTLTVNGLPGTLGLLVEGSAETAYCGPDGEPGSAALTLLPKLVLANADRVGADCPGFRPSVEWSYAPPADFAPSAFARLCLQGADLCDVPRTLLAQWATGSFDRAPQPQVTDFRLSVYTAVDPGGGGERAALAADTDSPYKLAATDGPVDRSCRPWPCIAPIAGERSALLSTPSGRGDWDSLYLKAESPDPAGISTVGCSSASPQDSASCIHLDDHWPGQSFQYGRGQQVTAFIVRRHTAEASPEAIESLVDGEPLRQDATHGYELTLWLRSTASSTQCFPGGGVDNTARPCRVLPQPLFFTPR